MHGRRPVMLAAPPLGAAETRTWKYGKVRYLPRGTVDAEEAVGGPVRAMIIELK